VQGRVAEADRADRERVGAAEWTALEVCGMPVSLPAAALAPAVADRVGQALVVEVVTAQVAEVPAEDMGLEGADQVRVAVADTAPGVEV
jgi:hypothetical protein